MCTKSILRVKLDLCPVMIRAPLESECPLRHVL